MMKIFEEFSVWERVDETYAIRYTGFKDLSSNLVCIVSANHLSTEGVDSSIVGTDVFGSIAISSDFFGLNEIESDRWSMDVMHALKSFLDQPP